METEQNLSDGNKQIQSLGTLQQFTLDQDPRVRTSALEALVRSSALSSPVFFRVFLITHEYCIVATGYS